MSIPFPPSDTHIIYYKERWTTTGDRRVIGALSGYMHRTYPGLFLSQGDYYTATCNELGAAL